MTPHNQPAPGAREFLLERIRALSGPLGPVPAGVAAQAASIRGVRAVLFDAYGTLVMSAAGEAGAARARDQASAFGEAFEAAGLGRDGRPGAEGAAAIDAAIRLEHERRRREGAVHPEVDMRDIWRAALESLRSAGHIGQAVDRPGIERLAVEYEFRVNPVWPMTGAVEAIAVLRRRGLRLGIVSNAQFFTPLMIEALFGSAPEALGFEPELTAWSYELGEAKPSLRPFQGPLRRLEADRIPPGAVAFVGNDRLDDMLPATMLGLRSVLFAGDGRSLRLREGDARCAEVREDAVVTRMDQLPGILA